MVYLLGMSHLVALLKAIGTEEIGNPLVEKAAISTSTSFVPITCKPGYLPGQDVRALLVCHQGWGRMAVMSQDDRGDTELGAGDGVIALLTAMQASQEDSVLFSFINGNEHAVLSIPQDPWPYDFLLPGQRAESLAPGFHPIAYEVVRRQILPYLRETIATLSIIRVFLPRMRLVHVLSPPPIESSAQLLASSAAFSSKVAELGITPFSIRNKYYQAANAILQEDLERMQITFLPHPSEAEGPLGGLRDELALDSTHGNAAYGDLVARQLQALLAGKAA